jgi:uncharacterized protein
MATTAGSAAPRVEVNQDRTAIPFLANAQREAERRGVFDKLVVDCDCHLLEPGALKEMTQYISNPFVRRQFEVYPETQILFTRFPSSSGDRDLQGRIKQEGPGGLIGAAGRVWSPEPVGDGIHPTRRTVLNSMRRIGIDYSILLPTIMLTLGLTPEVEVEAALAQGFNRWLIRDVLADETAIKTAIYLPISDPDASLALIEELGDEPSVVGAMITCVRNQPLHENRFAKVFAALNERRLPIAFHSGPHWSEESFKQFNRFISAHALGFPFFSMCQMTNWIFSGLAERFPDVTPIFMEQGIAWLPFMIGRLDNEYRLRSSEAPLLTKMPGDYIRDFYCTSQPIETFDNPAHMEMLFEMFNGENRLLFASDYPHQDFDLPSSILDLGFLSEEAHEKILGHNAARLFGLPDVKLQDSHPELFAR